MKGKNDIRKVAVPVADDRLCEHFGKSDQFYLYEIRQGRIVGRERVSPPPHDQGVYPRWLAEQGVTDVITGGIGQKAIDIFLEAGINVFDGAPVNDPESLVYDFLTGRLESLGNYCDH